MQEPKSSWNCFNSLEKTIFNTNSCLDAIKEQKFGLEDPERKKHVRTFITHLLQNENNFRHKYNKCYEDLKDGSRLKASCLFSNREEIEKRRHGVFMKDGTERYYFLGHDPKVRPMPVSNIKKIGGLTKNLDQIVKVNRFVHERVFKKNNKSTRTLLNNYSLATKEKALRKIDKIKPTELVKRNGESWNKYISLLSSSVKNALEGSKDLKRFFEENSDIFKRHPTQKQILKEYPNLIQTLKTTVIRHPDELFDVLQNFISKAMRLKTIGTRPILKKNKQNFDEVKLGKITGNESEESYESDASNSYNYEDIFGTQKKKKPKKINTKISLDDHINKVYQGSFIDVEDIPRRRMTLKEEENWNNKNKFLMDTDNPKNMFNFYLNQK